MFTLRLLGSAALDGPTGPLTGRVVQPRRIALLAVLAASPDRAASRDTLVSLLWPEARTRSARHLLATALYELRKAMGPEALVARGDRLQLNETVVRADVADFAEAADGRDSEGALALYRGPFLDGFYVSGAPELERWIDETRDRLARRFAQVAEAAAEKYAGRGDHSAAVETWHRLSAAAPYDSGVALRLAQALADADDAIGAVRHATNHAALLRRELDADPPPEIRQLMERLRVDLALASTAPDASTPSAGDTVPPGIPPVHAASASTTPLRTRLVRRRALLAAVLIVLLLGAAGIAVRSRTVLPGPREFSRVAVLPFDVLGAQERQDLGEGMVELLGANLDGNGGLRAVNTRAVLARYRPAMDDVTARRAAESLQADLYVTGGVFDERDRLRIRATLYERASGRPLATATVEGTHDRLLSLVDELGGRLLAGILSAPHQRMQRVAARTTNSHAALREYLRGEADYRAGRYVAAAQAFERAVREDSTFALAHYRLALSIIWSDRYGASPEAAERAALRYSGHLPEHDRLLVEALVAWRRGDADAAETLYRRVVAAYPDDVEAWSQLGETLFHYNPRRGRPIAQARTAFEQAVSYDPEHWGALWHLAELAAHDGRMADVAALTTRLLELESDPPRQLEVRAFRALALGEGIESHLPQLRQADPLRLFTIGWRAAVFGHRIEDAARVYTLLADRGYSAEVRRSGRTALAYLALAAGKPAAARASFNWALAAAADHRSVDTTTLLDLEIAAQLAVFPLLEAPRAELLSIRDQLTRWSVLSTEATDATETDRKAVATYHAGVMSAMLGEVDLADTHAQHLEHAAREQHSRPAQLSHALRARLHAHIGRPREALTWLDSARFPSWYGHALSNPMATGHYARWLRAELLQRLGRHQEALAWYATFGEHTIFDLPYLAPSHLRRGEIHELLGNVQQAKDNYRHVLALWQDSEPGLQSTVAEVRRRIGRLQVAN